MELRKWVEENFKLIWLALFAIFVVAVVLILIREYSFVQTCELCVQKGYCTKYTPFPISIGGS